MDRCDSTKRGSSQEGIDIENTVADNNSYMNMKSVFRIPESIFTLPKYANDDSLIVHDVERGVQFGLLVNCKVYYAFKWSNDGNRVVVADLENRRLEVLSNQLSTEKPSIQSVMDLDANGRRWEGGVKDGKPYGYGVVYDEEGKKEYEGFLINGMRICYGIDYYSDISGVKYIGCYLNSKRFGRGTLFDRNGGIDYEGLWMNSQPHSPQSNALTIDNHNESLAIPNKSFNDLESFILPSFLHSLKQIVIGNDCFGSVRIFELDGLSELKSVVIGQRNFRINDYERSDGDCRIMNCPKLNSIQIGDSSFYDYHSFELSNLPSLQSIAIGNCCFLWTPSFSLTRSVLELNLIIYISLNYNQ